MQIALQNSKLTLLLPKGYERVENGVSLYPEMYQRRKAEDVEMFQSMSSSSYGNIVITHIDPADSMRFGDKGLLINDIHSHLTDDQGLIEVETGTSPRGYEYIYSIIKTYHQDKLNVNYCLRMNIKNGDEVIEILATFFEAGMTGLRSAMGWNMAMSAGFEQDENSPHHIKGWAQDPYDPDYMHGCRMIMAERRGLDGLFPEDPLSQARELVLALTEDSYYKTKEEIDAEHKKEESSRKAKKKQGKNAADAENEQPDKQEDQRALLQRLFSDEVVRSGAYKVEIEQAAPEQTSEKKRISPFGIAKAAAKAADNVKTVASKTTAGLDKVKTPFEIPDDFRSKLNKPVPKELPGWGKRPYIGFGKGTFAMSGIMMSWPVTEQESLPLSDAKGLIQQFHDEMDDHQGLITVKCGLTPKGNRYAYVIRKMYFADEQGNQESPTEYELNFNIRINGKIHFINGSFQEKDKVPGNRSGMLYLMSLGSSELQLETEAWDRDPYDSNREKGFLMNWTEDEKYDGLFPYHPLSEMRRFISYVVENN